MYSIIDFWFCYDMYLIKLNWDGCFENIIISSINYGIVIF